MATKKKRPKKATKRRAKSGKTKVVTTTSKTTVVTKTRNGKKPRKLKWKTVPLLRGRRGFYAMVKGGTYAIHPEKDRWAAGFSRKGSMTIHDVRPKKSLGMRTHQSAPAAKRACELHAAKRPAAAAQRRKKASRARGIHNRNFWGS